MYIQEATDCLNNYQYIYPSTLLYTDQIKDGPSKTITFTIFYNFPLINIFKQRGPKPVPVPDSDPGPFEKPDQK
jgi:hypothetical protein